MPTNCLTSFDGLRRRMGGTSIHPSAHAIEAKRLIKYLQNLGFAITTADDVRGAIEADRSEAELSAHRCVEGVAVAHASDGWWLLFPHGSFESPACAAFGRSSVAFGDRSC